MHVWLPPAADFYCKRHPAPPSHSEPSEEQGLRRQPSNQTRGTPPEHTSISIVVGHMRIYVNGFKIKHTFKDDITVL